MPIKSPTVHFVVGARISVPEELPTTDIFVAARYEYCSKGIGFTTIEAAREYVLKSQNHSGSPILRGLNGVKIESHKCA